MSKTFKKAHSKNRQKIIYSIRKNRIVFFWLGISLLLIFFLGLFFQKRFSTKSRAESTDSYNTIIGGHDANPAEWQFFVRIFELNKAKNEEYVCGGVFIDKKWVLTAAHCVNDYYYEQELNSKRKDGVTDSNFEISIRTSKRIVKDDEFLTIPAAKVYIQEGYILNDPNDIALIKIEESGISEYRTIRLPPRNLIYEPNRIVHVAGYGANKVTLDPTSSEKVFEHTASLLQEIELPYGFITENKKLIIIAGDNKGTCNGDSGGPLVYKDDNANKYVIGIVSKGVIDCPLTKNGTLFVNVQYYLDWISEITGIPTP